jgi:hypothetical protein
MEASVRDVEQRNGAGKALCPDSSCGAIRNQLLVIVKFPDPLHPDVTPVNVHDPVIVLLLSVPVMVSTLPLGLEDCTVNSKLPAVTPLVLPLNIKPPVSDEMDTKQGVAVVKVRLVPVIVVPLLSFKLVVNENAAVPSVLVRAALQFPLTLVVLPLPHANKTNNSEQSTAIATCRISNSFAGKKPVLPRKVAHRRKWRSVQSEDNNSGSHADEGAGFLRWLGNRFRSA